MQIGQAGRTEGSNSTEFLGQPADLEVDPATNELYIADGYLNKRIIVFNAETGEYLRHWGAYGNEPSDEDTGAFEPGIEPIQQFRTPVHAVRIAADGMVYVADRVNNRIQVFQKDGTYVDEMIVEGNTLGAGSTWDLELSPDEGQVDLYNADGTNQRIHIINRAALEVETFFGRRGRYSGQFHWVHNVVVDSGRQLLHRRGEHRPPGAEVRGGPHGSHPLTRERQSRDRHAHPHGARAWRRAPARRAPRGSPPRLMDRVFDPPAAFAGAGVPIH